MTQQTYAEDYEQRGSYFARHWRGDISLGRSYWINGAVIGLVFLLFFYGAVAGLALGVQDRSAQVFGLVVLIIAQVGLFIWQAVGIWRSASKHVGRGGKKVWAILAKIAICLGVVAGLRTVANNISVTSNLASNSNYYLLPNVQR